MTGQTAPPGWYPHPSMAGTQQYWDGMRWTSHVAPMAPRMGPTHQEQMATTDSLETWGWLGAFFFPLVGVVIGIILLTRPGKNAGGWILGVSVGMMVLVVAIVSASTQPTYY